ncbi:hypothetical protein [Escherichia coli]|uniref:hypothetical protein n=1 Tax=Escherichia coli TaxID=562 RepID=UPI001FCDA0E7|nr:hypothetical protein [Escherichia coli]
MKNGHSLNSSLCKYDQIKDQVYSVSISWSKQPGSTERERNEYSYDMASFEGVSYLGARSPMTQIAEQMKKIREDWRPISQGSKKLKQTTIIQVTEPRNNEHVKSGIRPLQRNGIKKSKKITNTIDLLPIN